MEMKQISTSVQQTVNLFAPDLIKLIAAMNETKVSIGNIITPQLQEALESVKQINFKMPYSAELSKSLLMIQNYSHFGNAQFPQIKIDNSFNSKIFLEKHNYESNFNSVDMGPRTVRVRQNDIIEFLK